MRERREDEPAMSGELLMMLAYLQSDQEYVLFPTAAEVAARTPAPIGKPRSRWRSWFRRG